MNKKLTLEQRIAKLEGLFSSNEYEDAMKKVRKMRLIIDDINASRGFASKLGDWFIDRGYDDSDEDVKKIFSYIHEVKEALVILENALSNRQRIKKFLGE